MLRPRVATLAALLAWPVTLLALLGRQGPRGVAAVMVIGIGLPPLGRLVRPWLAEAVFVLLTLSFLRVDLDELRLHLRTPGLILAATLWTALGIPLLFAMLTTVTGVRSSDPGLFLGLMLQGLASPLMAGPALAALMGLDATLVLVTLVTGTIALPFAAPVLARLLLPGVLAVAPMALGARLAVTLAGSLLVGAVLRRLLGVPLTRRRREAASGLNLVVLLVFAAVVMGDMAAAALADPLCVIGLTGLAFAVAAVLLLATTLLFARAGRSRALSLGVMASQRNMGLMVAAMTGVLPRTTWLYFALSQVPIYLSPLLMPLLLRLGRRGVAKRRTG